MRVFAVLAVLFLLLAGVGVWWLRTPAGNTWLGGQLSRRVTAVMGEGSLEIGGVQTNVYDRVVLKDVVLVDGSGREVIVAPRASLEMGWSGLLSGTVAIERVLLVEPTIALEVDEDGVLDLSRMFPAEEDDSPPSDLPVRIEIWDARVDGGSVSYDPGGGGQRWAAEELSIQASARGEDTTWTVPDLSAAGVLSDPDSGPFIFSGGLRYSLDGTLDLSESRLEVADSDLRVAGTLRELNTAPELNLSVSAQTDLDALESITGDLGLKGSNQLKAQLSGPLDALVVDARITQEGGGQAEIDAVVDTLDPEIGYDGSLDAQDFDLQALLDAVTEPTVLTGQASFQGRGVAYPDGIDATGTVALEDSLGWGYPLPLVSAGFSFQGGQIRTQDLLYEAWWGRVTGKGRMGESDLDMDILAKVWDARGLEDFDAPGIRGSAVLDGRLQADWSVSDNVTTDLLGQLEGEKLGYEEYITIQSYEGPIEVLVDADGVQAFGPDASLTGIDASGVLLGAAEGDWEAFYDSAGKTTFQANLDGAVLRTSELHADSVSAFTEGTVSPEGVPQLYANLDLGGPGVERFVSDQANASVVLDGDDVSVDVQCRSGGTNECAIVGGGNLDNGRFAFSVFEVGASDGVRVVNEGPVLFRLTETYMGATGIDAHLSSVAGNVDVVGDLDLEGALDAQVNLGGIALSWIGALFPEEVGPLAGTASAWLELTGTAQAPQLDAHADVVSLFVPGQVWGMNLGADVTSQAEGLDLRARISDQDSEIFALRGLVPADLSFEAPGLRTQEPVDLDLLIHPTDYYAIGRMFPAATDLPGGHIAGHVEVHGTVARPTLDVALGTLLSVGAPSKWVRMDANLSMDQEGQIRLKGGGHERQDRLLDMGGRAKLDIGAFTGWLFEEGPEPNMEQPEEWLSGVNLSVVPLRVHTDVIRVFAELPDGLDGRVTGAIAVFGDLHSPQVSGALQLTEAHVEDLILEPAVLSLGPDGDGYQINGLLGFREDDDTVHQFSVGGFVPFSLGTYAAWDVDEQLAREGLDIEIAGDGLPLAILSLADPGIVDTYGLADIQGTVTGSLAVPNPIVDVLVADGGFSYPEINTRFRDLRVNAKVRQDRIELGNLQYESFGLDNRRASNGRREDKDGGALGLLNVGSKTLDCVTQAQLGKGVTRVSGVAMLEGLEIGEVDFTACANRTVLSSTAEQRIQVSSDLDLGGRWPELLVRGDVLANEVIMVFGEDLFFDDKGLALDPSIQLTRSVALAQPLVPEPAFYDPWDIQVNVDLNNAARLDVTVPLFDGYDEALKLSELRLNNARLDGALIYSQKGDFYDAEGTVNVTRGTLDLINKAFNIEEGEIQFSGGDLENPTLSFAASRSEGQYGSIGVTLSGTVENPELTFTSSEGYTNTDILTILLLGAPSQDVNGDAALAAATAQLTGALTEQLESTAQFNLVDSVQLDNSSGQGVDLVLGKSFADQRAYGEFTYNSAPDEDESSFEVTIDFVVTRRLSFQVGVDEDLSSDLVYTYRF